MSLSLHFSKGIFIRGLQGVVYRTSLLKEPLYHIKILRTDTEEAAVFQRLSQLPDPRNHTIPGELTPPEAGHPLLITPSLSDFDTLIGSDAPLTRTLDMFLQLMEVGTPTSIYTDKSSDITATGHRIHAQLTNSAYGTVLLR